MLIWQKYFLIIFAIYSLLGAIKGYAECKKKKNAFGESNLFVLLGAWVWGDALIFGIFWFAISTLILMKQDWILFLLITSIYWTIRSFGEIDYWVNQQFSTINRNPPEKMRFYNMFQNDSVWFVYQILWQCMAVASIVFSIYFAAIWFHSKGLFFF